MIKINAKECNTNIKIEDVIGFALPTAVGILDQTGTYLSMFWVDDVTYEVNELSEYDIGDDSTLAEMVSKLNICEPSNIIKVFEKQDDFTININF